MTNIQIFEPGLCCGTGICGVDVDQQLITFSADMDAVRSAGGDVTRFNLAQEPLAFAENDTARAFLHTVGQEGLPVVLVAGSTVLTGRYPSRAELARWAGVEITASTIEGVAPSEASPKLLQMAGTADATADAASCCGGTSCC
jgi:arsenite-transporting ATPase